jgi:hypothetical protein
MKTKIKRKRNKYQMNVEILKLSFLTFIAGVFCKIYDDLNDNNLFNFLKKKNKDYINEFLKGMHYVLLIYVSSIHIYPLLLFVIPNLPLMIVDSNAFDMPYEYSGMIVFSLFSLYLIIDKFSKLKEIFNRNVILLITIYIFGTYCFDTLLFKNIEFGYKKFAVRAFAVILAMSILVINYCFKLIPDELIFCLWYIVGYCLTSCFFQILLIFKSKQDQTTPEPTNTEPTNTEPTNTEPTNTEPTNTEPTNTEPTVNV